jgi:sugar/nucleoside kinase (ribokinase family)
MPEGIIGAGNWIIDQVKMIDRWPETGELCNIMSVQESGGGGPCNVLFDIAALKCGIPLYACGLLGNDDAGKRFIEQIKNRDIDSRYMFRCDSLPTSFTDVMTEKTSGRRTFFHNRGANAEFEFKHIESLDVNAKIFYLGYLLLLDKLDSSDPKFGTVAAKVLAYMKNKGCLTVVDMVSEDREKFAKVIPPALKFTDCLVINEVEAGSCCGIQVRGTNGKIKLEALVNAARKLLDYGVQQMVVIHFPEGALAVERDGCAYSCESCHIVPGEIVGSVGAGDAFCAGIIYGLYEKLSIPEMLRFASISAWFNLKSPTATEGAPDLETLFAELKISELRELEVVI